jgi:uncharacterized protein (TIGR02246 family)
MRAHASIPARSRLELENPAVASPAAPTYRLSGHKNAHVEDAMNAAEKLDELEAIKSLKARYFRCIDTKNWTGYAEIFEPDVTVDLPNDGDGYAWRDREEFIASTAKSLEGVITVHHGHMPEIELTSPTTAKGIWAMQDVLYWPATAPGGARKMTGYGHYNETYVKKDGRWRIATLRLTRLNLEVG